MANTPIGIHVCCICCEGQESFGDCPLCDNNRFFLYELDQEEDIADFYSETYFSVTWLNRNEEEKKNFLNAEIDEYMK